MNGKKKMFIVSSGVIAIIAIALFVAQQRLFSAPQSEQKDETFIIALKQEEMQIVEKLKAEGFIKNISAFGFVLTLKGKHGAIQPGGHVISKNMNVWRLSDELTSEPDLKWVVVPEGWRKEQIGELLAETFGWDEEEIEKWDTIYTGTDTDYREGTYFPDTYLIPVDESGADIAKRMVRNFNEKFASYLPQFSEQNIKWTTGLKIASLIQRETASKDDMPIISAVIWNRLDAGMKLQIDATVQYARGDAGAGWWASPTSAEIRNIDSPYNTYLHNGLPPAPISNPGLDAIDAVLHPAETDCLFYLHDRNQRMYCAATYEEHLANIEQYLKK